MSMTEYGNGLTLTFALSPRGMIGATELPKGLKDMTDEPRGLFNADKPYKSSLPKKTLQALLECRNEAIRVTQIQQRMMFLHAVDKAIHRRANHDGK